MNCRRRLQLATALVLAALAACGDKGGGVPGEIPEALRGAYGQNEGQAHFATVGLELDANALRYGELTVTVVEGELMPNGDYLVKTADAVWEKDKHPSKKCHGTISRQDDVLLVKLYKAGTEDRCESLFEGEWKAWAKLDAVPESLRGTYGGDARGSEADVGLRLGEHEISFTDGGDRVKLDELVVWQSKPDQAFVRAATFKGFACKGTIARDGEKMKLTLEPGKDAPAGASCPSGSGVAWTVDEKFLPTKIDNGKVTIERNADKLVLRTAEGLRCEQHVLRTSARSVTGSAYDGIPVTGGAVIVLEHADPSAGAETCTARLRRLAADECMRMEGTPCDDATLDTLSAEPIGCPRQLVIGDPTQGGHKAALLPATVQSLACWDMSGVFAGA